MFNVSIDLNISWHLECYFLKLLLENSGLSLCMFLLPFHILRYRPTSILQDNLYVCYHTAITTSFKRLLLKEVFLGWCIRFPIIGIILTIIMTLIEGTVSYKYVEITMEQLLVTTNHFLTVMYYSWFILYNSICFVKGLARIAMHGPTRGLFKQRL